MKNRNTITVFEHQTIRLNEIVNEVQFDNNFLLALQAFHGEKGVPYFSLGYKCIKFCEYVGVIQIGDLSIEVLPKVDSIDNKNEWRKALIGMLQTVDIFEVKAPSSSTLKIKPNSILELYFQLFVKEIKELLRLGLIKKYKKADSNCNSLKGNLIFSRNLQKNLVHKERFFTSHTVYDVNHKIHQILWKTLLLMKSINTNTELKSQVQTLLLIFPEQKDFKLTEAVFSLVKSNQKIARYESALEIARLLLLNYYPDVSQGRNHVLALMFDMNMLWEKFVLSCLRKKLKHPIINFKITAQSKKYFWKPEDGYNSSIKPDIIINFLIGEIDHYFVLDTKWKNLNGCNPSPNDLRQLYVYHEFYGAERVALVYPGKFRAIQGTYYDRYSKLSKKECMVISINCSTNIDEWQQSIIEHTLLWMNLESLTP